MKQFRHVHISVSDGFFDAIEANTILFILRQVAGYLLILLLPSPKQASGYVLTKTLPTGRSWKTV